MIKTLNDLNQLFKHDSYNKIAKWLRLLIKPQLPPIKQTEKQATKTNFKNRNYQKKTLNHRRDPRKTV